MSNKVDLDSVLNAANDYYSLAPAASPGSSAANGLAGIVGGGQQPAQAAISLASNGPLDARKFDVTAYTAEVLQHTTIRGLYEQDTALRQEIRSLDGFLQDLVYKNYSKFINATDTIRNMRDNVVDIDAKLQALSTNVDDISTVNQTISSSLDAHRSKIQEMLVRNAMLQKIKFLVDLPASMARGAREGRYSDVVTEWVKGDSMLTAVLKRHPNVASFARTQSECRKVALDVYERLTNIIKTGGGMAPIGGGGSGDAGSPNNASPTAAAAAQKSGGKEKDKDKGAASLGSSLSAAPIASSIDAEDAAMMVRLAFADLKRLVPTSIFTDQTRPTSIESEVISMQTSQIEALLKANIDVAVATVVTDIEEAVAAAGAAIAATTTSTSTSAPSSAAYEVASQKLAAVNTDLLHQSLKFSYAKYASSVHNLQGMIAASLGGGGGGNGQQRSESALMEEIAMRVSATTKTSLVRVIDALFPAMKRAATTLVRYIVLHQRAVTDSHRAAADVARAVQGVCEGAFAAITSLLNALARGAKQLSARFLNPSGASPPASAHTAMCVMVDDAANGVLQGILGCLTKFAEGPTASATSTGPSSSTNSASDSSHLWIVAHESLIAAYIAKFFVHYSVESFGDLSAASAATSASAASALQGAFASLTRRLVATFVMLAGQHFSHHFQTAYFGPTAAADCADISGPHRAFQTVFRQWMGLHSECAAWFPDGQGNVSTNRAGYRHERSDSVGSNASSQRSGRPSLGGGSSAARLGGGVNGGLFTIPAVAAFTPEAAAAIAGSSSSKFGGGSRRLAIVPTTIDARHIEEAVIINSLLSLAELARVAHFTKQQFHQLQVDLSFVLQQTGPNSSYWLRDELLFVNIVNAVAVSAYSRIVGADRAPLTQGMVEKLARKDD